jgi:hypothetical protein
MDIQITEIHEHDGWFSDTAKLIGKKIISHNLKPIHLSAGWHGGAVVFEEAPIAELPTKTEYFFEGVKYKPWRS